jgi:hypothetical protein
MIYDANGWVMGWGMGLSTSVEILQSNNKKKEKGNSNLLPNS